MVNMDKPEEFNRMISEFIDEIKLVITVPNKR